MDDIIIWNKDPMGVIKSLVKTYLLKNIEIPVYCLRSNIEIEGAALILGENNSLVLNTSVS